MQLEAPTALSEQENGSGARIRSEISQKSKKKEHFSRTSWLLLVYDILSHSQNFKAEAINDFIAMEDQSSKLPKSRNRYLHCTLMNFWLSDSAFQDEGHLGCTNSSQKFGVSEQRIVPRARALLGSAAFCANVPDTIQTSCQRNSSFPWCFPLDSREISLGRTACTAPKKTFFYHFSNRSN